MIDDIDATVAEIAGQILSGLLAANPSMSEQEAIEKAVRMARATVVEVLGTDGGADSVVVLQASDFTYLGASGLPLDSEGVRFGFSTGALSGRVVNGKINLLVTGAQAETGWMDPVYEVEWTAPGTRCTMVMNWGDVTQGKRVSAAGNAKPIHGLLWDEETQQLLSTYTDDYNVGGMNDPCLIASTLDRSGVTAVGPWRMTDHSMRVGGYLVALPHWLQMLMKGARFGAGAPIGSGNASSAWGAFMSAFELPPASQPPDTLEDPRATILTTHLIYSDYDHKQPREGDIDECGWTNYGVQDSKGAEPQHNTVQDGRGCTVNGELCGVQYGPFTKFSPMDVISAAAWVAGTKKHGLVMIGQMVKTIAAYAQEYGELGRCHEWYGPAQVYGEKKMCAHGQNDIRYGSASTGPGCTTMQSSLFLYDPDDIAAVVNGTKSPILLPPVVDALDMSTLPHDVSPFPQVPSVMRAFGGAWYEPESQILFVSECHAEWQGEWHPVIHAFAVTC